MAFRKRQVITKTLIKIWPSHLMIRRFPCVYPLVRPRERNPHSRVSSRPSVRKANEILGDTRIWIWSQIENRKIYEQILPTRVSWIFLVLSSQRFQMFFVQLYEYKLVEICGLPPPCFVQQIKPNIFGDVPSVSWGEHIRKWYRQIKNTTFYFKRNNNSTTRESKEQRL